MQKCNFYYYICVNGVFVSVFQILKYWGSPDSTNFVLPGNRTIAKIVLSGG